MPEVAGAVGAVGVVEVVTVVEVVRMVVVVGVHSGKSLFPNICGLPLLLFFRLKWAGYLAVAGLNLLAQISDRISHFGV